VFNLLLYYYYYYYHHHHHHHRRRRHHHHVFSVTKSEQISWCLGTKKNVNVVEQAGHVSNNVKMLDNAASVMALVGIDVTDSCLALPY
jgi:hypothetical protein